VPQPQYVPQLVPPQQPQYPNISADDLVNHTGEVLYNTALQAVNPFVQRVQQLDNFMRQSFESNLSAGVARANAGIAEGWRNVFAKDPAVGNKQVLQTVENLVRQQRQQAIDDAYRTGNFSQLDQFNNPKFYQAALAVAKVHVGYPGGQAPQVLNVQGAYAESSRSVPTAASTEIPEGIIEMAERLRISDVPGLWKRVQDAEKKRKEMGWNT